MERTIDNSSPQIRYYTLDPANKWETGQDPAVTPEQATSNYYKGTLHRSGRQGDWIQYTFQGSSIYVIGTRGLSHGNFTVQIDNGRPTMYSGKAARTEFRSQLFAQGGMSARDTHTITITNVPVSDKASGSRLDLDMFIVRTDNVEEIFTSYLDDSHPSWKFSGSDWITEKQSGLWYSNDTAHSTTARDATVTIPFHGTSIALYGVLNNDRGNFSVSVDGKADAVPYSAYWDTYLPDVPLYTVAGLENGDHELVLTNIATSRGSTLNVDYAVVNSTTYDSNALPPPSGPGGSGSSPNSSSTSSSSQAAIIGGAVGGGIALVLLAVLGFCFYRRQKRRGMESKFAFGRKSVQGVETYESGADKGRHDIDHVVTEASYGHGHGYGYGQGHAAGGRMAGNVPRHPSPSNAGSGGRLSRLSIDAPPSSAGTATNIQTPNMHAQALPIVTHGHGHGQGYGGQGHAHGPGHGQSYGPNLMPKPDSESPTSEGSAYSFSGGTFVTDSLSHAQRDALFAQLMSENPCPALNPDHLRVVGGPHGTLAHQLSYGSGLGSGMRHSPGPPSIAASSQAIPHGNGPRSVAASSTALPSPIKSRGASFAAGFPIPISPPSSWGAGGAGPSRSHDRSPIPPPAPSSSGAPSIFGGDTRSPFGTIGDMGSPSSGTTFPQSISEIDADEAQTQNQTQTPIDGRSPLSFFSSRSPFSANPLSTPIRTTPVLSRGNTLDVPSTPSGAGSVSHASLPLIHENPTVQYPNRANSTDTSDGNNVPRTVAESQGRLAGAVGGVGGRYRGHETRPLEQDDFGLGGRESLDFPPEGSATLPPNYEQAVRESLHGSSFSDVSGDGQGRGERR